MQFSISIIKSFIPLRLICHNFCEEYEDHDQDMVVSNEDHNEEEDSLGRLMELVNSLSAEIERFKFEESAEDFPVLEADVLGSSTKDDDEYFIVVEALHSAPDVPAISSFDDY